MEESGAYLKSAKIGRKSRQHVRAIKTMPQQSLNGEKPLRPPKYIGKNAGSERLVPLPCEADRNYHDILVTAMFPRHKPGVNGRLTVSIERQSLIDVEVPFSGSANCLHRDGRTAAGMRNKNPLLRS